MSQGDTAGKGGAAMKTWRVQVGYPNGAGSHTSEVRAKTRAEAVRLAEQRFAGAGSHILGVWEKAST